MLTVNVSIVLIKLINVTQLNVSQLESNSHGDLILAIVNEVQTLSEKLVLPSKV